MAVAVDSAKPLINEMLRVLKRTEEVLALVGIFYVGKLTLPTLWEILKGLRTHVWSKFVPKRLVENYGNWAVVTGSTDGIGKAYAFELAKNGMNIVLISRTMVKLEDVAREIRQEFGVETEVVQADFSKGRIIYDNISRSLAEKDVGILVNNVGMVNIPPVMFEDVSDDDMWGMININTASVPAVTKLVLPGMLKRKRGAIINISSIGGLGPLPLIQIYTGTKAFVDFFSRALEYEYRSSGIVIQTVLPGAVVTNMTKSIEAYSKPSLFVPTASTYAYHALSTLGYARHTTGYWGHGIVAWFYVRNPEWLTMWWYGWAHKNASYKKKTA